MHSNILTTLLNIYLNALPEAKMEGEEVVSSYQANQRDKKREELREKINVCVQAQGQREEVANIVRVRFDKIRPEGSEKKKSEDGE